MRGGARGRGLTPHRFAALSPPGSADFRDRVGHRSIEELSNAAPTGRLAEALHDYIHSHILVIEEIGYLSLTDNAANILFQVVNERYLQRKLILFITSKPLAAWAQVFDDPNLGEAILDRVLKRGRHIQLRGPIPATAPVSTTRKGEEPTRAERSAPVPGFPEPTSGTA